MIAKGTFTDFSWKQALLATLLMSTAVSANYLNSRAPADGGLVQRLPSQYDQNVDKRHVVDKIVSYPLRLSLWILQATQPPVHEQPRQPTELQPLHELLRPPTRVLQQTERQLQRSRPPSLLLLLPQQPLRMAQLLLLPLWRRRQMGVRLPQLEAQATMRH
ncbi:hypothetical protein M406DRAFT_330614 [Cryphonectria parasitica EP155]|uniref:Uncharacterized protein n=1 Tax=Cryphonectria parasitica (strain ATCC 38755 / EP155) TaxID=660469 RepID=A0A9P5CMD9_CRYP1|nr:uncharacterized protein M406DRAFT_330614 [Cryphonectria parasitica EP155]KAF3764269.1 hypothetical protein M406DRAFT_330614 [Cryphonectria parasitica EP155]